MSENAYFNYVRTKGFVLVDDIGMAVMQDAANEIVPERAREGVVFQKGKIYNFIPPPGAPVGLMTAAEQLSNQFVERFGQTPLLRTRWDKYGYVEGDGNNMMFADGIGDQDFTWHFAPAIANAAVEAMVNAGEITGEQRASLTLGDYANVIGSGWFSGLMHDLALTGNGIYGSFGRSNRHYARRAFQELMHSHVGAEYSQEPFIAKTETETDDLGVTIDYKTVALSPGFRREIRKKMARSVVRRAGCPVARHAGTLPVELFTDNLHGKKLVDKGILELGDAENGKVRFYQETTPIDLGLMVLADKIDHYARLYGEPYVYERGDTIFRGHKYLRPTNILWQEVDTISAEPGGMTV